MAISEKDVLFLNMGKKEYMLLYNGENYRIQRTPMEINSLHVEYDYCYLRPEDCIDISTENDSFYCYPTKKNVVTKLGFAVEAAHQLHQVKAAEMKAARRAAVK